LAIFIGARKHKGLFNLLFADAVGLTYTVYTDVTTDSLTYKATTVRASA